jgi:hypothetical protein
VVEGTEGKEERSGEGEKKQKEEENEKRDGIRG